MNESINKFQLPLNTNVIKGQDFVFNENLDRQMLQEFYGKNIDEAYLMFRMFLRSTAEEFLSIIELMATENLSAIVRKLHKMKPNFKMVGLSLFYDKFSILESQFSKPSLKSALIKKLESLEALFASYYLPIIKLEIIRIEYYLKAIKK